MLKNTIQYGEDSGRDWANSKERPDVQPASRGCHCPMECANVMVNKNENFQETNVKNKNKKQSTTGARTKQLSSTTMIPDSTYTFITVSRLERLMNEALES